ncbi:enkurin-like isoform X2 [Huso huso]|uniref:Enkurin-like isoform X2 n=1 Tax=Huso huso TaxID=61971 RepID=A0ABR1A5S5_HUSHU
MTDMFPAESIYNLIPGEEVKVTKQPRHTSKFRETVKEETQRHKAPNKTMGPVKVDVPSPEKFLQKHSKEPKLANKTPLKKLCDDQKKPRVPLRTDHPVMGIQTKKNFIKTNAVEMIMSVPKKPQPNYVDTRRGDKQLLDTSGLVPKFTNKKDYGQTPEYLIKRNEEVQRAQEEYDAYIKERILQGSMKQLSDEERDAVLQVS